MIRNDISVTIRNSRISNLFILIFISNVIIKSLMVSFYPFTLYLLYVFCLMYVHIPPWLWAIIWELGIEPGSSGWSADALNLWAIIYKWSCILWYPF